MNKRKLSQGFTVLELLVVITLLTIGGILFVTQKSQIDQVNRDNQRKSAINSMYYNLEEVFYQKNSYYPSKIDSQNLKAMDPNLFIDPLGTKLGDTKSEYRYEPKNCVEDKCKSYTLRADLEQEDDFIKESRNK